MEIGKRIYGNRYIHKDYLNELTEVERNAVWAAYRALDGKIPVDYNIVRVNGKTGEVAFIVCRDFNTANEPLPDLYCTVKAGKVQIRKGSHIWHHKWMFVGNDYTGFNIEASKARSKAWQDAMQGISLKQIGCVAYWDKLLEEYGLAPRR